MAEYHKKDLNSWGDFVDAVHDPQQQTPALRARHPYARIPELLFRGQGEASWTLDTTLERYKPSSLSLAHYYTSISTALPQIEAHTGQRWEIERADTNRERTRDSDAGLYFKAQSACLCGCTTGDTGRLACVTQGDVSGSGLRRARCRLFASD